jgi:transposase-like protein
VTEQQLARMAKRRLAILRHAEEITGNVSLTCRYYGISRQCFYTWRRRYDAHGLDGPRDRSHRPQVSPNATRTESWARSSTASALLLRAGQDRDVPQALPRGADQQLRGVADPVASTPRSSTGCLREW